MDGINRHQGWYYRLRQEFKKRKKDLEETIKVLEETTKKNEGTMFSQGFDNGVLWAYKLWKDYLDYLLSCNTLYTKAELKEMIDKIDEWLKKKEAEKL